MAGKMKAYHNDSTSIVPRAWLEATGAAVHHAQGEVVVVARTKADALRLVADRGWYNPTSRLFHVDESTPTKKLIDAGVIDMTREGVYAARNHVHDHTVVSVDAADQFTPVARWEYGRDGLTVHAL